MPRAYGWNTHLLLAFESVYGTAPATGSYHQLPLISNSLGSAQGLIESNVVGLGRDPSKPLRGEIVVDGDINVPVDVRNIGFWLKALLGDPTTTGSGPYLHTFGSGAQVLPSLTLEAGYPQIPSYPLQSGVRLNSLGLNFERSGEPQASLSLLGQGEAQQTTTIDTTPDTVAYDPFSQFQGSIKSGGTLLANVTSANVSYSNNLEAVPTIRDDGKVDGIDPGIAALTGNITVRYADNTLIDQANNGTPVDLEFGYVIDNDNQLLIKCHEVYLPKPKIELSGPGGVEVSYDFQGADNTVAGRMVTFELTNDVTGY